MKRDMDLVRRILLAVEKVGPDAVVSFPSEFPDEDPEVVKSHVRLLQEARLIEADISYSGSGMIRRLTWKGHEFLADIGDEGVWNGVRQRLASVSGGASLELVRQLAIAIGKERLGLNGE